MKISTAMALGRTLIKPLAGVHLDYTGTYGCAWGMVNMAVPGEYVSLLRRARFTRASLPCGCPHDQLLIGGGMLHLDGSIFNNLGDIIVHLFNDHVMTRKDWTMDQLIEWVAANEPPDPEEVATEHADLEKEIAYA